MNRTRILAAIAAIGTLVGMSAVRNDVAVGHAQVQVPKFQYDPSFPQPLPEKWAIGPIGGMAIDSHDHLWVLQRPGGLEKRALLGACEPAEGDCASAPPVLELVRTES